MLHTESSAIRLLIVDDHEIVRTGLRTLFQHIPEIELVGEADGIATAVAEAARTNPSVVLMDLRLADGSGVAACREILAADHGVRVLFLTSYGDEDAMLAAVFAGASGYLLKEIGNEALVEAVKAVAAGRSLLDPAAIHKVTEGMRSASTSRCFEAPGESLAPQEQRVVALVAQGKTNKEIAAALNLSDKTVKNYLSNVFQKLRINRRAEAAAIYTRRFS